MTPTAWELELAVRVDGELVGIQSVATRDFAVTRTGETGSWVGTHHHGQGYGTRMRQAFAALCFDHLGFEEITSAAFADNPASLAVSRKVGYRPNGIDRKARRGGTQWQPSQKVRPDPRVLRTRGADHGRGPGARTELPGPRLI
ncbi:MAG TPA: GNAT family protein [Propionibacteriaceae bacterium]|nr:GNAT family protein [Propionibacteriaceae bacterium]